MFRKMSAPLLALGLVLAGYGFAQNQSQSQDQNQSQSPPQVQSQEQDQKKADSKDQKKADSKNQKKKKSKDDVEEIGNRDVGNGVNWYSLEKEIALGKALAQQVEAQSKLVDDPVVTEYVNRIGQNLVRNSDAKVPFTIKVIDADEVNAFALPGGFFFVNSGVVMEADEEAELAGVMAHEIAHVAARHGTRNATKGQIANILSIPLIFVGGPIGMIGRNVSGLGAMMAFSKFSRGDEAEADHLGLQYMYKAGYDPQAFVTFFEKMQAKEKKRPGTLSKMFASHPQTPDRIAKSQQEIATVLPTRAESIITTSEFDDVKARLEALHNRRRPLDQKNDKPTLRRTTTADGRPVDDKGDSQDSKTQDGRPTLKRRND